MSNSLFAQVHINEISSKNNNSLIDEFGVSSDWLELYNAGTNSISLKDYYLSDDENEIQKWQFPDIQIAPQDYLIIFASGLDLDGTNLHTNFKLSSNGEMLFLTNPSINFVEEIIFPPLEEDMSYGRKKDGDPEWVFFLNPTPNTSNEEGIGLEKALPPRFVQQDNRFENAFDLEILCDQPDCQIYFTTDGSAPTLFDQLYDAPIRIEASISIRAIALTDNTIPSNSITKTFINDSETELPILCLSINPEILFEEEYGIFRTGLNAEEEWPFYGANYWDNTKHPFYFEYLKEGDQPVFESLLDGRMHGGRSARTRAIKPLRFLANPAYDIEKIEYPFFDNLEIESYNRIVIRNGSGDYNGAYFRDAFISDFLSKQDVDLELLSSQTIEVYLNGKFWAIMNLREKSDEFYAIDHFGYDINKLDFLEEDTLIGVGNFDIFHEHYDFVRNNDLSIEANYIQAESYFDLTNLTDLFVIQTYLNNADWAHNNIKYFRPRTEDGKWRYVFFDLDVGMGGRGWTQPNEDVFGQKMVQFQDTNFHVNILQSFLDNEGFHDYFINRYSDLTNTIFQENTVLAEWNDFTKSIDKDMQRHYSKWTNQTYEEWLNKEVPSVNTYFLERPFHSRNFIQAYFQLANQVELQLNTYPENAGKILVNTVIPKEYPWKGTYYNGVPVELTIIPNPGFTFSHWESIHTITTEDANTSIKYNYEKDDQITAYFEADFEGLNLIITPNPIEENVLHFNFTLPEIQDVQWQIYNSIGQLLLQSNSQTFNAGKNFQTLSDLTLEGGIYLLNLQTENYTESQQFIVD